MASFEPSTDGFLAGRRKWPYVAQYPLSRNMANAR